MSMFTDEYWENFGKYGNITNEEVQVAGPTAKKTNGDSYSEQDGNSVSKQNGNKNTIQVGWSNSLTYGFSFSTLGGASFSTTGGAAFSNHVGVKWAAFFGPEISINAAMTVKVTKGWAYTFDTVTKCENEAQKIESALKKTEIAAELSKTIGQEISTLTGFTQTVGGLACCSAADYRINAIGAINLWSTAINIDGEAAVSVSGMATSIEGIGTVAIKSNGPATISGLVIKIG
jgi:hypothetical protein